MSKIYFNTKARLEGSKGKFNEMTIDTDKIVFFQKSNTGNSLITFINNDVYELDIDYFEFFDNLCHITFENEIKQSVEKLMSGHLSNNSLGSVSTKTMVKDCFKIVEQIARYDFKNNL